MALSKVEKEIFLELIEEIDIAHDYIFANTDPKDNLRVAGKTLMKLKKLVELA